MSRDKAGYTPLIEVNQAISRLVVLDRDGSEFSQLMGKKPASTFVSLLSAHHCYQGSVAERSKALV